ncbi:transposase [Melittangium boletus]|uniref:transposase n=1 Tax=Melittangium boletus TaxID=83453 RepID=UPI003DA32B92
MLRGSQKRLAQHGPASAADHARGAALPTDGGGASGTSPTVDLEKSAPEPGRRSSGRWRPLQEAETKGYDAGKKIKGRRRHLLVDTLGLLLIAWMTTGDVQDRDATPAVLPLAAQLYPSLKKVWVDGGYAGPKVQAVAQESGIDVEVVKRSDQAKGFVLLPKRWIGERTFGWLNRQRRLSKDYERQKSSSEAFIHLGMIDLMLRRRA